MRKKHPRHDDDGNDGNTKFSNIRMIAGHEKCIMPFQPTSNGRINGCWVPPIVACVNYYKQDKKNKERNIYKWESKKADAYGPSFLNQKTVFTL